MEACMDTLSVLMFTVLVTAIIGLFLVALKTSLWLILKVWKPTPHPIRGGKKTTMRI